MSFEEPIASLVLTGPVPDRTSSNRLIVQHAIADVGHQILPQAGGTLLDFVEMNRLRRGGYNFVSLNEKK